jgi:hypothetical protein
MTESDATIRDEILATLQNMGKANASRADVAAYMDTDLDGLSKLFSADSDLWIAYERGTGDKSALSKAALAKMEKQRRDTGGPAFKAASRPPFARSSLPPRVFVCDPAGTVRLGWAHPSATLLKELRQFGLIGSPLSEAAACMRLRPSELEVFLEECTAAHDAYAEGQRGHAVVLEEFGRRRSRRVARA